MWASLLGFASGLRSKASPAGVACYFCTKVSIVHLAFGLRTFGSCPFARCPKVAPPTRPRARVAWTGRARQKRGLWVKAWPSRAARVEQDRGQGWAFWRTDCGQGTQQLRGRRSSKWTWLPSSSSYVHGVVLHFQLAIVDGQRHGRGISSSRW